MFEIVENLNYDGLFTLYLIVSVNFLTPTFSCKLQEILKTSMLIKHIVGFVTLYIFVILTLKRKKQNENKKYFYEDLLSNKIALTIFLYTLFIISSKCEPLFLLIFLACLGITYFIRNYYSENGDTVDNSQNETKNILLIISNYTTIISMISLVVGFILYYGETKIIENKHFNIINFLMGRPECNIIYHNKNIKYYDMLKSAFTV